jgi:hypothetical protein
LGLTARDQVRHRNLSGATVELETRTVLRIHLEPGDVVGAFRHPGIDRVEAGGGIGEDVPQPPLGGAPLKDADFEPAGRFSDEMAEQTAPRIGLAGHPIGRENHVVDHPSSLLRLK